MSVRSAATGWFQGWLTVFQLQAMLMVVASIVMLVAAGTAVLEAGAFLILIMASLPAIGLVLLMRRSRYARVFWISLLSLIAAGLVIALIGAATFWRVGMLGVDLAWIGYWIWSPRVRATFPPLSSARSEPRETGPWFQGWLTIFQGYMILLAIIALVWFFANADDLAGPGALILLLFASLPLYGVRLIAARSPYARRFSITVLALSLVLCVLALPDGSTAPEDVRPAMVVADVLIIVVTLLWLGYWVRRPTGRSPSVVADG